MTALNDIEIERRRQVEAEGWTAAHDDALRAGQLANAAACYAYFAALDDACRGLFSRACGRDRPIVLRRCWPWSLDWWKPKDRRRDLVRAGALIVAEIERLDRQNGEVAR